MSTAVTSAVTFNLPLVYLQRRAQHAIIEVGMNLQINSLFNAAYFNSMVKNSLRSGLAQFYWVNCITHSLKLMLGGAAWEWYIT
jgi:hypothetical protein